MSKYVIVSGKRMGHTRLAEILALKYGGVVVMPHMPTNEFEDAVRKRKVPKTGSVIKKGK